VVDSTGTDARQRARWLRSARKHGAPAHAVVFATPAAECRRRNRARPDPVPSKVLTAQLANVETAAAALPGEGWDGLHEAGDPGAVALVPPLFLDAPDAAARQQEAPMPLDFALHVSRLDAPGGAAELADRLTDVAVEAERMGFTSLWLMDHMVQIPTVGREWEDMLESYTTLAFLAARTSTIGLGVLVTGVTYRNLAHLAKIIATVDVLSGGRAVCGIGTGWFQREHELYGYEFPPVARRYDLLTDALELLPLMWGKGSPPFAGRTTTIPAATCYPRPLQERVPIMVGGSGERRTLRLVAEYADACNLFGDAPTVAHKVEVLRRHCADVGRDPADVRVTHLGEASVVPAGTPRAHEGAGTLEEQVGRYRQLAEAGVQTAIIAVPELLTDPAALSRTAGLLEAFPRPSTRWPDVGP
jgi:F420-dependent oxidoreductase-like protein